MATREGLERLKCGDKILVNGSERIFIGLKPIEINCSYVVVCLNGKGNVDAQSLCSVEMIPPKKKLYAYEDKTDGNISWHSRELKLCYDGWKRAPEWDREEV